MISPPARRADARTRNVTVWSTTAAFGEATCSVPVYWPGSSSPFTVTVNGCTPPLARAYVFEPGAGVAPTAVTAGTPSKAACRRLSPTTFARPDNSGV